MNIKRRDFFKALGATVCGVVISILGLSKMKKRDATIIDKTEPVQEQEQIVMNFAPDEIVSSVIFHGRFYICCKYSIWELEEGPYGSLQRKLITHT